MNIVVYAALLFAVSEIILTAVQFAVRKKEIRTGKRVIIILAKVLTAIIFAVLPLAGPVFMRPVQPVMMAAYIALFADAAADILCTVFFALTKKGRVFPVTKVVSLLCGILFFAYAVFNMLTVKPNYHTYTSEKLSGEHTLVFIADLHTGSAQPFSVTEKTVADVRALNPDFTVLGGDIVDDYTTKEEMIETFRLFKDFETPVYYIYGNHDRQGHAKYAHGQQFTQAELEKAMTDCNIIILKDEFARISPDLLLLGREDMTEESRVDISALENPDRGAYLVTADHQPSDFKNNITAGTDLQISGHTHAGQLFPLKFFYALIGGYVYGDYEADGSVMNVSAGACGWRMPFRTDAHCNYEVITLKPAG